MHALTDTKSLLEEGVITRSAARIIEARARDTMIMLAINAVLCSGIFFATFGLIFWLADAFAVALSGAFLVTSGVLILRRGDPLYAMFGNAAALIGAGMVIGGAGFELAENYEDLAGWIMSGLGAAVAAVAARALTTKLLTTGFVTGAVTLMGLALHLVGVGFLAADAGLSGVSVMGVWLYTAVVVAAAGWLTDVRLVSALAIVPFAQMLDTGTFYFHAAYVFYSPEPTLSILQMVVLIAGLLWWAHRSGERTGRHLRIHVVMAFVVANLCALVGSLWGDVVGSHLWGPGATGRIPGTGWEDWRNAMEAFEASALVIDRDFYSVGWAVFLAGLMFVTARRNMRGLFNAAVTFAAVHGYTQSFETFYDEPLAYVVGGLTAIPLAWGMWRLNAILRFRDVRSV